MTRDQAIQYLTLYYNGYISRPRPELLTAAKLGKEALEIVIDIQDRFPTLIPKLLPCDTPIIDNHRSLHHIKEVLERTEVG